ncbi:hypothetical protein JCM16303_002172, partial [Sporobolomyces ruberrimus]
MLPSGLAYDALPPAPPMGYVSTTQSPAIQPSINSPALSTSSKRKAATAEDDAASTKKRKQKGKDKVEPSDDESEDDGKGKKKRNRMALSCKECKRRKIKCDRVMPVCGHCSKRGRPNDCTWDVFQPANDAFLPPTIARTSELEHLADRLAHVESYLKTLPPNFALFRPLVLPAAQTATSTPADSGTKEPGSAKPEKEAEDGYSD